jgi:hypothetical protein
MSDRLRLVIGCDEAGFDLKSIIAKDLSASPLVESVTGESVSCHAAPAQRGLTHNTQTSGSKLRMLRLHTRALPLKLRN